MRTAAEGAPGALRPGAGRGLGKAFALRFAAVSLLAAGCARRETPAEAGIREQVLHLGNGSEPRDLDPHVVVSFNDFNIVLALF